MNNETYNGASLRPDTFRLLRSWQDIHRGDTPKSQDCCGQCCSDHANSPLCNVERIDKRKTYSAANMTPEQRTKKNATENRYYAAHSAEIQTRVRTARLKNPEQFLLWSSRNRAKKKGMEFTITVDDITIPELCPYLGIKLEHGQGITLSGSPSLDRIDNSLGYIPGNVEVISHRANSLKRDATSDELTMIATRLADLLC